ncbi:hypothetical protein D031_3314A, partial [Vibrio parahaemolyticus VP-48]
MARGITNAGPMTMKTITQKLVASGFG